VYGKKTRQKTGNGGGGGADDRATSFGGNGADGKVVITYIVP